MNSPARLEAARHCPSPDLAAQTRKREKSTARFIFRILLETWPDLRFQLTTTRTPCAQQGTPKRAARQSRRQTGMMQDNYPLSYPAATMQSCRQVKVWRM
jgi:hypothetical protein